MVPMAETPTTAAVSFDGFLPEGETLYPFQQVGIAYSLLATTEGKGTFIADEQGLGKTRQAIVTAKVHAAMIGSAAPKILVVCKSALKGNWAREIDTCAPEWSTQILAGTRPYETIHNVSIISFNLLKVWTGAILAEGFDALIIDESHVVKDPKTQQTKAALTISEDIRNRRGLVLLLSGTPLLNRPLELVAQLQILGRLEDVAPKPHGVPTLKNYEYSFKNTFCGNVVDDRGHRDYSKGADNLDLLNLRLRGTGLVRRLRNDVLDLSDTHRITVPLSLNGGLDPYWDVEANFVAKDPRSEAIELLTALRQEVALCKIPATIEWVEDFIAENPDRKLVVWAWHVPVQVELTKALNAAGIPTVYLKGEQNKGRIEAAKARFNQGDAQVIVCSLQAHREGHTLVGNGHNVTDSLFVEQPWHPGAIAQSEDRINRIGREAAAVFAHTLVVPGTVDEWLADLIAAKWETFRAAVDGTIPETEVIDIAAAMVAKLVAHMQAKHGRTMSKGGHLPKTP